MDETTLKFEIRNVLAMHGGTVLVAGEETEAIVNEVYKAVVEHIDQHNISRSSIQAKDAK